MSTIPTDLESLLTRSGFEKIDDPSSHLRQAWQKKMNGNIVILDINDVGPDAKQTCAELIQAASKVQKLTGTSDSECEVIIIGGNHIIVEPQPAMALA